MERTKKNMTETYNKTSQDRKEDSNGSHIAGVTNGMSEYQIIIANHTPKPELGMQR